MQSNPTSQIRRGSNSETIPFNRIDGVKVNLEKIVDAAFTTLKAKGLLILAKQNFPLSENQQLEWAANQPRGFVFSTSLGIVVKTSEAVEFESQLKEKIRVAYGTIHYDYEWNQPGPPNSRIDPDRVLYALKPFNLIRK